METAFAIIGSGFLPTLSTYLIPEGLGVMGSMFVPALIVAGLIVVLTWLTSIIRSIRYCRDDKGNIQSYGLGTGLAKGLIIASFCIVFLLAVQFIPFLKVPLKVLSLIPGFGEAGDGVVVLLGYMFAYFAIVYPVYGSC